MASSLSDRAWYQHFNHSRNLKRALDVVGSALLLASLSPVMLLIALLIKLDSPGPVLYEWRVVGKRGRPFSGFKFRTMVQNADVLKASLMSQNEMTGPVFKIRKDPRVTRVGRILRKTSLDELPQLWSVLRGDMSLVGPRPPLESEYALFDDFQKRKLDVTPGITCLWQVSGRNDIKDFEQWVRLDLEYIRNWSLVLDAKILLKTLPAVLRSRGAS